MKKWYIKQGEVLSGELIQENPIKVRNDFYGKVHQPPMVFDRKKDAENWIIDQHTQFLEKKVAQMENTKPGDTVYTLLNYRIRTATFIRMAKSGIRCITKLDKGSEHPILYSNFYSTVEEAQEELDKRLKKKQERDRHQQIKIEKLIREEKEVMDILYEIDRKYGLAVHPHKLYRAMAWMDVDYAMELKQAYEDGDEYRVMWYTEILDKLNDPNYRY